MVDYWINFLLMNQWINNGLANELIIHGNVGVSILVIDGLAFNNFEKLIFAIFFFNFSWRKVTEEIPAAAGNQRKEWRQHRSHFLGFDVKAMEDGNPSTAIHSNEDTTITD